MDSIQEQIKASGLSRKDWYGQVYLRSQRWKELRARALIACGYKCQGCCCENMLQVHHLTYDRIGAEPVSDLMVLCSDCHGLAHKLLREMKKNVDASIQRKVLSHFLYYALVSKGERIGPRREKRNHNFNTLPQSVKKIVAKAKKSLKQK